MNKENPKDQWRWFTEVTDDVKFSPTRYQTTVYVNTFRVKRVYHAFQHSAPRIARRAKRRFLRDERKDAAIGAVIREGVL